MALNPLPLTRSFLPAPAQQRFPHHNVDRPAPRSAREWEQQLDEELQGSLTYQVVKRVLLKESATIVDADNADVDRDNSAELDSVETTAEIAFQINVQVDIELKIALAQTTATAPQKSDPLVLDLHGDGIQLAANERVQFDITGDGKREWISQLEGDNYFLAVDTNGNQRIDDGHELFGDQHGDSNGFEALARFDDNHDHLIDAHDRLFSALRLVQLRSDGSQTTIGLAEKGIKALDLRYQQTHSVLNSGDEIAQQGQFIFDDHHSGKLVDMLFQYRV